MTPTTSAVADAAWPRTEVSKEQLPNRGRGPVRKKKEKNDVYWNLPTDQSHKAKRIHVKIIFLSPSIRIARSNFSSLFLFSSTHGTKSDYKELPARVYIHDQIIS
jgi:hypothetical protein